MIESIKENIGAIFTALIFVGGVVGWVWFESGREDRERAQREEERLQSQMEGISERLDAVNQVCEGRARASSFDSRDPEFNKAIRDMEGYRERGRERVMQDRLSGGSISWFDLAGAEQCQVARSIERGDQLNRYMDRKRLGIN